MSTSVPLADILGSIPERSPLVVSYTNAVTIESVANTTLHWGGLPVMSNDEREAADMLGIAGACYLNMGTVSERTEELLVSAGATASREGIPVVFDPVGAGATNTRSRVADRILKAVDLSVIKGNYGEISALVGDDAEVKGVESVGEYEAIATSAISCARRGDCVVVASGETDIVATADRAYELTSGHELMGQFVGSGCMLGVTLATVLGSVGRDRAFEGAVAGTAAFGIAGERAAASEAWHGPASYQTAFLDTVASLSPEDVSSIDMDARFEEIAAV